MSEVKNGRIKWFDRRKGFGFIDSDEGDVMVHVTTLQNDGITTVPPGSKVTFSTLRMLKGLRADKVFSVERTSSHPPSDQYREYDLSSDAVSAWLRARVKWFNHHKGYGFLTHPDIKRDIFIHADLLSRAGLVEFLPEQIVWMRYAEGPSGLEAVALSSEQP